MLCLVVLLSVAGSELAIAQILKLQNPLIVNGERFTNPVYDSHDASRLFITHKTGATGLPIDDLPYELQVRLGYNRSNALAAEEAHIKRQEQAEVKSQADQEGMLEQATAAATKAEMVNRKAASMLQPSSNEYDGGESSRSAVAETVNSSPTWAETQFVRGSMGRWFPLAFLKNGAEGLLATAAEQRENSRSGTSSVRSKSLVRRGPKLCKPISSAVMPLRCSSPCKILNFSRCNFSGS